MRKSNLLIVTGLLVAFLALFAAPDRVAAQGEDPTAKFVEISTTYRTASNITYFTANGHENKLDVYMGNARPRGGGPNPTVVFYHGGGGVMMSKEDWLLDEALFPYFSMGWTVVNVEYRLASVAHAPAAVEDARCALKWVHRNAERYNFDLDRLVVTGASIGGMLATLSGILPTSAGLDRQCLLVQDGLDVNLEAPKVSAVVDWYGVMDLADSIDGPNARNWAVAWVGATPDRFEIAARVSPLTHARPGLPPMLIIHGDSDQQVLHTHAEKMHAALDEAGVPNELFTVVGGGHGQFTAEQNAKNWAKIRSFLGDLGFPTTRSSTDN